jgi:hypothetical protein
MIPCEGRARYCTGSPDAQIPFYSPFASDNLQLETKILEGRKMSISILFVAAQPTDKRRLRLEVEFQKIQEELLMADRECRISLKPPQLALRPEILSRALLREKPDIVHFSGHGLPPGELCFEDASGKTHPILPESLSELFSLVNTVYCVVLNACYTEKHATAIAKHVKYVIGMDRQVTDAGSIAFSVGFYQALGYGYSVEDAYRAGCIQIKLQNIPDHLTPILKGYGLKKGYNSQSALNMLNADKLDQRIQAIKWIGETRQTEVVPILAKQFEQEADPEIKYWIIIALSKIGGENVIDLLNGFYRKAHTNSAGDRLVRLAIEDGLKNTS